MLLFKRWKINGMIKKIKSLKVNRQHNQPSDAILRKEIALYFELADLYKKLHCHKKFPYAKVMMVECYRSAADLDDAEAHYKLAVMFIDEAKFRFNVNAEGVFTSEANLTRSRQLFDAGHAHLLAAEKLNHVLAKRLRGLCIINGWGVEVNKDAGFELVVASIDEEGSWDKVPQIFAEIGLNKPEFFAAIMQRKTITH